MLQMVGVRYMINLKQIMMSRRYNISVLKSWLCKTQEGRKRITDMYAKVKKVRKTEYDY